MRSLLGQVRPDRQTLLFSATMPRRVEALVRDAVSEPVRVTVGGAGANEDIRQVCTVGYFRVLIDVTAMCTRASVPICITAICMRATMVLPWTAGLCAGRGGCGGRG